MVGVHDSFGESGVPEELMVKYGLTAQAIVEAAEKAMSRKQDLGGKISGGWQLAVLTIKVVKRKKGNHGETEGTEEIA
jgi:hypothetical protein